jgi:hypothetical protein
MELILIIVVVVLLFGVRPLFRNVHPTRCITGTLPRRICRVFSFPARNADTRMPSQLSHPRYTLMAPRRTILRTARIPAVNAAPR